MLHTIFRKNNKEFKSSQCSLRRIKKCLIIDISSKINTELMENEKEINLHMYNIQKNTLYTSIRESHARESTCKIIN